MKCTICGAEIEPNSQICNNCGTKVSEMGGNFGTSQNNGYGGMGYSNQSFGSQGFNDQSFGTQSFGKAKSSNGMSLTVIKIVVLVIALLAGLFVGFYRDSVTKTFDMDGFSIKLPMSMKLSDSRNKYSLGLESSDTDAMAKSYSNNKIEFAYIRYDLSSEQYKGVLDTVSEEDFAELMEAMMGASLKNYHKVSLSGGTMKFTFDNEDGENGYVEMRVMKSKDAIYLMICICDNSKRSKYSSKFSTYLNSIKFK